MPTLKAKSARGISLAGSPTWASAPANPRPWSSPKAKAIAHGARRIQPARADGSRVNSTATTKIVTAIRASTGAGGIRTMPNETHPDARIAKAECELPGLALAQLVVDGLLDESVQLLPRWGSPELVHKIRL